MAETWSMTGSISGSCNCDWGCPCNFDVAPTYGHCDGVYLWAVRDGTYGNVQLANLHFAWAAHSPGPLHEGNATGVLIVDESAAPDQRDALERLWRGGEAGLPFDIFNSITATWLDTIYAPFEVELAGIDTKAKIGGGEIFELAQSRVKNPVNREERGPDPGKPNRRP